MTENERLALAEEIKHGLFRMSTKRVVALSSHATRDLIEELEEKAERLIELLKND